MKKYTALVSLFLMGFVLISLAYAGKQLYGMLNISTTASIGAVSTSTTFSDNTGWNFKDKDGGKDAFKISTTGQLSWPAGLGPTDHVLFPSDQPGVIRAGSGQDIVFKDRDGSEVFSVVQSQTRMPDMKSAGFGGGNDALFRWSTSQTNSGFILGMGLGGDSNQGGAFIIINKARANDNWKLPIYDDVTIVLQDRTAAASATHHGLAIDWSGIRKRLVIDDVAPDDLLITAQDAYSQAVTNTAGSDLVLAGGIGPKVLTVVAFGNGSTDTVTVTVNGSATVLTEGTHFDAITDNATTATDIAAAIDALSGVSAVAVSAVVYTTPAVGTYSLILATGDATAWTVTNSADGSVRVPTGLAGADGAVNMNITSGVVRYRDNVLTAHGNSNDAATFWETSIQTTECLITTIKAGSGIQSGLWLYMLSGNQAADYTHAFEDDPTWIIHSRTAAGSAVDQFLKLQHDTTQAVIDSGAGGIALQYGGSTIAHVDSQGFNALRDVRDEATGATITAELCRGATYTNESDSAGATPFILPPAAAGLSAAFYVVAEQTMTITASAGDTITVNNAVSSAAGSIASVTTGSHVHLVALNATSWRATTYSGDWSVDGTPATNLRAAYWFSTPAATSLETNSPQHAAGTTTGVELNGWSHANNSLTYNGIAKNYFRFVVGLSATKEAGATSLITFRLARNGTPITGAFVSRQVAATDEGAMGFSWVQEVENGESYTIQIENETNGNDVTIQSGGLSISSMSQN